MFIESSSAEIVPELVNVTLLKTPLPSPICTAIPSLADASMVPELSMTAPEPFEMAPPVRSFPTSTVFVVALIVPELFRVAFVEFSISIATAASDEIVPEFVMVRPSDIFALIALVPTADMVPELVFVTVFVPVTLFKSMVTVPPAVMVPEFVTPTLAQL